MVYIGGIDELSNDCWTRQQAWHRKHQLLLPCEGFQAFWEDNYINLLQDRILDGEVEDFDKDEANRDGDCRW